MRWLAAAALAALPAVAQDAARWGPVAESLGVGTGMCLDGENIENIVCAVVLCEEGSLSLGVLGTGQGANGGGEQPAFRGRIDIDGETVEREMEGRLVMQDFLHVRTPIEPGEPLWQSLRRGSRLALSSAPEGEPLGYSLRGSAAELDRVAAACR